jgi:hypothetical protein
MLKLRCAQANSVALPLHRPGSCILVRPEDIGRVFEIAIYNEDGSYDGTRHGSCLHLKGRDLPVYTVERPEEIAELLEACHTD